MPAQSSPPVLSSWMLSHDASRLYTSSPYIITFGSITVDIWRTERDQNTQLSHLSHIAPLSHHIEYPKEGHIIADPSLGILAIENTESSPSSIWVFSLVDGVRTVNIAYASILNTPFRYRDGKALIGVKEGDVTLIYHFDLAGDDWLLGDVIYPETPDFYDDPLFPVLLTASGDVLAIHTRMYCTTMTLLRWRGPVLSENPPLAAAVEIALTGRAEDCDLICHGCTISMGADAFLLAAEEVYSESPANAFNPQTVLHAIDSTSLQTRWRAETVWGRMTALRYLPDQGVVAGVGWRNLSERGPPDLASFVVVWDAETGACRRLDSIRAAEHGCKVDCFISTEAHPSVLVVSKDGKICRTPLEEFIDGGFTRREGRLAVYMALPGDSLVSKAAAGERSLVVLSRTASMASDALSQMSYFAW